MKTSHATEVASEHQWINHSHCNINLLNRELKRFHDYFDLVMRAHGVSAYVRIDLTLQMMGV